MRSAFTPRQGQYLAFIYYYTKINRRAPAEADIQKYFKVAAPTVHQMVIALEAGGYIARTPGQARSLRVQVAPELLPHLE
jgi:Mn-dependent DtxR family transcriptional regulator